MSAESKLLTVSDPPSLTGAGHPAAAPITERQIRVSPRPRGQRLAQYTDCRPQEDQGDNPAHARVEHAQVGRLKQALSWSWDRSAERRATP